MKKIWHKFLCWLYREPMWFDWRSDTYWCPNCEIRLERGNGWERYGMSSGYGEVRTYEEGGCPKCGAPVSGRSYTDAYNDQYPRAGRDYM